MRHKNKVKDNGLVDEAECRHYWIIESPGGPISKGVCRLCGAVSEFRNYVVRVSPMDRVCRSSKLRDLSHSDSESDHEYKSKQKKGNRE